MRLERSFVVGAVVISLAGCGSNGTADPAPTGATPAQSSAAAPPTIGGTVPPTLRSTIASTLKVDESRVIPAASFTTDLGANEISMVELVMAYERVFKVRIPDADADRFKQVQDVLVYLQKHSALR